MDSRDERGQLILVAAFGLAVAFVVLALVLNTVVFTENLATRNHDRTDDAVAFEGAIADGVGGLVSEVNDNESATYESLRAELDATIPRWSANVTRLGAARGSLRTATLTGVENGMQLVKPNATNFSTGTLAPSVNDTRRFQMLVTPEPGAGVTVGVTNGTDSWNVTVSENGTNASWTDVVVRQRGTVVVRNTTRSNTVEVDVTEGLVNGTRVDNWTFAEGVGEPYKLSISSDSGTSGKYVLFIDRPSTDSESVAPKTVPAIYRVFVDASVRTDTLTYESNVSVAPSDPVGNETYDVAG